MGWRRLILVPQLVILFVVQVLVVFPTTTTNNNNNWCCDCFQLGGGGGGRFLSSRRLQQQQEQQQQQRVVASTSTTTISPRSSLSSSLSLSSSTEESDAVTTTETESKDEEEQQQLKVVPYVIDETVLSKLLLSENNDNDSKTSSRSNTQTKLSLNQVREYDQFIESLPTPEDELDINGGWNLLATISPNALEGDNVDFFDINSWTNYINGSGPSPFQSLITGSSRVDGLITQWLTPNDFDNVVEFNLFSNILKGKLVIKASLESIENNNQKRIFKFRNGFFILNTIWNAKVVVPYPVPFKLLGDRAIGSLETIGYDPISGIRAAVGNKGTKFIFQKMTIQAQQKQQSSLASPLTKKEGEGEKESSSSCLSVFPPEDIGIAYKVYSEQIEHDTDEEERTKNEGLVLRPVVICPQQFGGKPGDYTELINKLRKVGHPVYLVRLSTLEWLSITKSAFSKAYLVGELEPKKALPFYLDAIDKTVAKIPTNNKNDNNNGEYSILSHSIGGWIARAWLGEVATPEQRKRCIRYVSLGTPHLSPPPESLVAKVDQTRGLLKYINDRWPGSYWNEHDGIEYTCVASKCVSGKLELNLDSLLAYASYFALSGDGAIQGDGITPVDAAILDGSRKIVLDDVYHADVLPNPIGGTNTKLVECVWYADRIDEWVDAL